MTYEEITASQINRLCYQVHSDNARKGFWEEGQEKNKGEVLALIHSEISEALEALRKDKNDSHLRHRKGVEVELADAVIRIFDMCGAYGYDLGGALFEKLEFNKSRPHKHGKEF